MSNTTYTEYFKNYYETKVKNNPEKKAKISAYHAEWQKKNKDKWNAYRREWRRRKKCVESEGNP
jgi:hypothetical protein